MNVSDRFKHFLLSQRIYVKDLAEQLGVTQSALNRVVRGEAMPSSKILVPLSKMGVNINWLLLGEEDMFRGKFYLEKHNSPILTNELVPYEEPVDTAHPLKEAITILQNEKKDLKSKADQADLRCLMEERANRALEKMHDLLREQIATYEQLLEQKEKFIVDKDTIIQDKVTIIKLLQEKANK